MNFSTSRRADNASNFVINSPPNMIYIVNNYINNKNDSLSYQPELKLNGEFYTEGILDPTTLFYINFGLNLATKRVNVEIIVAIIIITMTMPLWKVLQHLLL